MNTIFKQNTPATQRQTQVQEKGTLSILLHAPELHRLNFYFPFLVRSCYSNYEV